jgi:hypothetical protein
MAPGPNRPRSGLPQMLAPSMPAPPKERGPRAIPTASKRGDSAAQFTLVTAYSVQQGAPAVCWQQTELKGRGMELENGVYLEAAAR